MPRTLLVALVATALLAPAASAAEPQVVDRRGDANGVNDQGVLPVHGTVDAAGTDVGRYDLLGVRFTTYRAGRKPAGFTVSVLLAEAPGVVTTIVVKTVAGACKELWLEYLVAETGDTEAELRHRCTATGPADPATYLPVKAVVSGATLTFTVPLSLLPPGAGVGTTLTGLRAETRTFVGAVSAPVVDVATSAATYRVGS